MSTRGRTGGSAAKLAGVAEVGPAPAAPAGTVVLPGVAGPGIRGAVASAASAASAAARWPRFLARSRSRSLSRIPVGGVESWRLSARDLFSPAPDRSPQERWATPAPVPAPVTGPESELVDGSGVVRGVARTGKGLTSSSNGCTPNIEFVAIFRGQ